MRARLKTTGARATSVARGLALTRSELAQLLDRLEQLAACLLLQNRAQQTTERAHVAPERRFLRLALARRQLVQALALVFDLPQTLVFAHLVRLPFSSES